MLTAPVLWQDDVEAISLTGLLAFLLRHRRLVVGLPVLVAFLWAAIALVLPRHFTSEATFTPSSSTAQLSQLAGLAAQFGVTVPEAQTNESPGFYAQLIQSRQLLSSAVLTRYRFPESSDPSADTLTGDLVEVLDVRGSDLPLRVARAIDELQDRLSVSTDATTGLVTIDVQTRWAALSQSVAQRLLDLVNIFNLESRQTQASAERQFLEGRTRTVRDSLRSVEDSLQIFLEHNRSYESSPELQFEYDRLQRRVTFEQQVYTNLAQSLEQAKIDEVRNTPVITVVEAPALPARPDRRHLIIKVVLGIVLGTALAVIWAFGSEWARRARQDEPEEYLELGQEWAETKDDVLRLWARLRRRGSR